MYRKHKRPIVDLFNTSVLTTGPASRAVKAGTDLA
jgi:hypothetical protein